VTIIAQVEDPLDGTTLARARTVLVSGDPAGRPVPLPEAMHAAAAKWQAQAH
jgi:acyl-CoA thioesterase FadM